MVQLIKGRTIRSLNIILSLENSGKVVKKNILIDGNYEEFEGIIYTPNYM